jgi:SAM-dependent methyltransferase
VVDVAAGTGKLTRALVATGTRVIAIEPLAEMRRVLRASVPEAEAVDATAEELPFEEASVDAITVAAAFHWFDARRALDEFARVLRPGGGLGLVWNVRDPRAPIQRELDELLEPYSRPVSHVREFEAAAHFPAPPFGPLERADFEHEQRFDADGLVERVASMSFVAILPDDEREELLARVHALGLRYDAPFVFPYRTEAFVSRRA